MTERMWTYPELKFVFINRLKLAPQELAVAVNKEFHDGQDIRNSRDIEKVKSGRNIFNKKDVC